MIRSDQLEYLQEYFATENNCNRFHPGYKLWSYTHVDGPDFARPLRKPPRILVIKHNQKYECEHLAGMHYTNRHTQNQVGYVFQDIYDRHCIAWMLELFL